MYCCSYDPPQEASITSDTPDQARWNHANPILEVADVSHAIAYYRDLFGLIPGWTWEDRAGGVHTEHSSIEIYFAQSGSPTPSRLAVFVEDADVAYEKCRAAGADIVEEPVTQPWGLRGFTVRDPDGNLIGIAHEVASPAGRPEYRELSTDE